MNYKLININTVSTEDSGSLSFFEGSRTIPFEIKRVYYITNVPKGKERGFHAHKNLKQLLFCPYGEIIIKLDDGKEKQEILLNDPSIGIFIEEPLWREMYWMIDSSVLCVAASDYYDPSDYLREYSQFLEFLHLGITK